MKPKDSYRALVERIHAPEECKETIRRMAAFTPGEVNERNTDKLKTAANDADKKCPAKEK